jgi:hypothetical protein
MATNYEQTYKLASLVLSFSALKRNKYYLRSTKGQERLNHFFLLSVDKALVGDLKEKPNFYDQSV